MADVQYTNTTNLSNVMINNAKSAVEEYRSTADGLYQNLASLINTLTTQHFIGDASTGYKNFFDNSISPAIQSATGSGGNVQVLLDNINTTLDYILQQMNYIVDPNLGEVNSSAGGNVQTNAPTGNMNI